MVLTDADLLEGVVGGNKILEDEEFNNLPPLVFKGVEEDSDEELEVDEGISNEEIAELLDDANNQMGIQGVDLEDFPLAAVEEVDDDQLEDNNDLQNCLSDQDSSGGSSDGGEDAPSLVSEPKIRSTSRSTREPERYNPTSGGSYHQHCHHNLVKQTREKEKSLEYSEQETEIVAHILTKYCKECFVQQYMLGKGLKVFPDDGPTACKIELKQMHERQCFKAIAVAELTRQERVRAQEGLMLLTKKEAE